MTVISGRGPVVLRSEDGGAVPLNLDRWLEAPTPEEHGVLQRVVAPVLDVGCGPGRHVLALAHRGIVALGIDAAPSAVRIARGRGAAVLERSVFGRVPGAGRWGTVLLLDGNVGIGGDPVALLRRAGGLLRPRGLVLVEVEPPSTPTWAFRARIEADAETSPWFQWAQVGADRIGHVARAAGLLPTDLWRGGMRWFASLAVPPASCSSRWSG